MDRIPEIMDGKNVADFVDEDIDRKLALLEQEEDQLQVRGISHQHPFLQFAHFMSSSSDNESMVVSEHEDFLYFVQGSA